VIPLNEPVDRNRVGLVLNRERRGGLGLMCNRMENWVMAKVEYVLMEGCAVVAPGGLPLCGWAYANAHAPMCVRA